MRTDLTKMTESLESTASSLPRYMHEYKPSALTYESSIVKPKPPFDPEAALTETDRFWQTLSDHCPDVGTSTELVRRSLITLKALT